MSLLSKRRAQTAAKVNDFGSLKWENLVPNIDQAQILVGKNAQLKYGIATETDIGLDETKYVLVPILDKLGSAPELAQKYDATGLMSGIHIVANTEGVGITRDFPLCGELREVAEIESRNRTELKDIEGVIGSEYRLIAGPVLPQTAELTFIAAHLNYMQFKDEYEDLPEGYAVAGAHAVAMAYRCGLLESRSGREFMFVNVTIDNDGGYTIKDIDPKYNNRKKKPLVIDTHYGPENLKLHSKLTELGLGAVIMSGTTHYMMNHTTGGRTLNGHNLKALSINQLYVPDPGRGAPSEERQTDFWYNVLHPVNKRGVASIVLEGARVNSWYKNIYLPNPSVMYSDTFTQYRQRLVPSGAHKAYLAAMVLRDITQSGLGIFLPDQELCNKVVRLYEKIKTDGARAHVGSRYYTDEPMSVNQGDIDAFLPLAAYYVQHKMATSSLAASPHLSNESADAAHGKWKMIIDATVRISAVGAPMEQIKTYMN